MATRQEVQDAVKFDLDRLPVGFDAKVSEDALAILNEHEANSVCVERVADYARQELVREAVKTNDFIRTLERTDGRLALVTWSSGGIASIGYRPSEQRFEVGSYSSVRDIMGDDPESHARKLTSEVREELHGRRPDVVCRDEADLLEPLNDGGDA